MSGGKTHQVLVTLSLDSWNNLKPPFIASGIQGEKKDNSSGV